MTLADQKLWKMTKPTKLPLEHTGTYSYTKVSNFCFLKYIFWYLLILSTIDFVIAI